MVFNVRYIVFLHELSSTRSDSFMYCDDSMKKYYYKNVEKFMVVRAFEIHLEATTASLSNAGNLLDHEEIKMNLNNFLVETELVTERFYNITITDNNKYREKREFISKKMVRTIVNYLEYCIQSRNYPFCDLFHNSVHVGKPN